MLTVPEEGVGEGVEEEGRKEGWEIVEEKQLRVFEQKAVHTWERRKQVWVFVALVASHLQRLPLSLAGHSGAAV